MTKVGKAASIYKTMFWVVPKYKLIFPLVPKTASTSFRRGFEIWGQDFVSHEKIQSDSELSMYKSFAVYRNPLNRFVAGFLETLNRVEPQNTSKKYWKIQNLKDKFYVFVREVQKERFDSHIGDLSYYLSDANGKTYSIDYWLEFENLNEDYNKMAKELGIKMQLPHFNAGNKPAAQQVIGWIEEDEDLQDIVDDILKDDYKLYKQLKG